MGGVLEIATEMMMASEKRLSVTSENIANTKTSGYRASSAFLEFLSGETAFSTQATDVTRLQSALPGKLETTNRALDFAIAGTGYFMVSGDTGAYLTRGGAFEHDGEGRILNLQGLALQSADGNDVYIQSDAFEVLDDGTVLEDGLPTTKIGVFNPGEGAALSNITGTLSTSTAIERAEDDQFTLQQGMLELSNVNLGDEMLQTMESVRMAETGARVIQTYNTLLGQAISTFGQGGGR